MNGDWIEEIYIFVQKKYAYKTSDNKVHSVFSGVGCDTLTWEETVKLSNGEIINKNIDGQLFHNRELLEITIKNKTINITAKSSKELVDNSYKALNIYELDRNLHIEIFKDIFYIRKI